MAYRAGRDVRQVGSNARGVDHIVEGELIHQGRELQEQRQRLERAASAIEVSLAQDRRRGGAEITHLSDTARGASNN
jgi:hypothetical protein